MKIEFIRFVIVGFINTADYYLLYLFFNQLTGLNYLPSHVISFIISMIGSFYLNSYYTYKTRPTIKKFIQFPLTYVVNITVSTAAIYMLVSFFHINETISPVLSVIISIPFTFVISGKILKADQSKLNGI